MSKQINSANHIYISTKLHTHIHKHTIIYTHMCMYVHVCTHTQTHTHAHTHTHTHIHTHTSRTPHPGIQIVMRELATEVSWKEHTVKKTKVLSFVLKDGRVEQYLLSCGIEFQM